MGGVGAAAVSPTEILDICRVAAGVLSRFNPGVFDDLYDAGVSAAFDASVRHPLCTVAFLRIVAKWRMADELRVKRREVPTEYDFFLKRVEGDFASGVVDRLHFQDVLVRMPQRQVAVLMCRFWLGMTDRETADSLGLSVDNVKIIRFRAMERLRDDLDG